MASIFEAKSNLKQLLLQNIMIDLKCKAYINLENMNYVV